MSQATIDTPNTPGIAAPTVGVGSVAPLAGAPAAAGGTAFAVLGALSLCHLLNDMMQSLIPALFPVLKDNYGLTFTQIGLLAFTFQLTASLLQPLYGWYTDRNPQPRSLSLGMGFTLVGLLALAWAGHYWSLLVAAALVGVGSSIFHPGSSRMARAASGGQHGLAQSVFQVGGNAGSALGPLLAALVVLPLGQHSVAWFALAALVAMAVLWWVGSWAIREMAAARKCPTVAPVSSGLSRGRVVATIAVLGVLVFSKYIYMASLTSYYTFYLIQTFGLSIGQAQIYLFVFLGAVAVGTVLGGPIGDRIGRKPVIWMSILGILPFTLVLPYANLFWTAVLTVIIGLILASAFSAILVYAQELVPGRVGMISGGFFGFAFGMGGLGAAALGILADRYGIGTVYHLCSFLPLLGLLTVLLPRTRSAA